MDTIIRLCTPSDLEDLCRIGRETYDETFRAMNTPETINRYLDDAFNKDKIAAELVTPGSRFYFLYAGGSLAGYIKVNDVPAQSDINDPESLELERIYLRKSHQGKGLGALLMGHALQLAREMGKRFIWLGVWEKNDTAIIFYQRQGFVEFGRHFFKMGDENQTDLVMRKMLTA